MRSKNEGESTFHNGLGKLYMEFESTNCRTKDAILKSSNILPNSSVCPIPHFCLNFQYSLVCIYMFVTYKAPNFNCCIMSTA